MSNIYSNTNRSNSKLQKYGFIYLWFDKKKKRYYIGSHWGTEDDGYICSSQWMHRAKSKRPKDFKRRIIKKIYTNRKDLLKEEQKWLNLIKDNELAQFNTTTKKRETVRYYNFCKSIKDPWFMDKDRTIEVGKRISESKSGKSTGPCSPEKAKAISIAKKKAFAARGGMIDEHKQALRDAKKDKSYKHTEEWKQQNSIRMKEQWSNGTRKRAEPKVTMTREEQDKLCSEQLKKRWADPVWAENQRKRLSEGAKNRPPRSEESKMKARLTQLGKPKPRKNINI